MHITMSSLPGRGISFLFINSSILKAGAYKAREVRGAAAFSKEGSFGCGSP